MSLIRSIAAAAALLSAALAARAGGFLCNSLPSVGSVGSGSAGAFGAPSLAGVGLPDITTTGAFSFEVSGGFPNAPGVLILQRREQPIFSTVFQTTIYTGANGVMIPFVCDAGGHANLAPYPITHPIAELCGMDLIAQVTLFDFTGPGGATWSNGLRFRFGAAP